MEILVVLLFVSFIVLLVSAIRFKRIQEHICNQLPNILGREWMRGREIRRRLVEKGMQISSVAFYVHMDHLVKKGMVETRGEVGETYFVEHKEEDLISSKRIELCGADHDKVRMKLRYFRLI